MRFGPVALEDAEGAIVAHTVRLDGKVLKKGTVLGPDGIEALRAAGRGEVVAAILGEDDVHEDEAAHAVARAVAGEGLRIEPPATGRSNLFSATAGLLRVDEALVNALNALDPSVTLATLPDFAPAAEGRMVATVKVNPFAVPRETVERAREIGEAMRLHAFRPLRVGLVAGVLPGTKPSVLDKTRRALDERLEIAGAHVVEERRVAHDESAIADALDAVRARADLLVVFGASAIVDRHDVIPEALERAGGRVTRFGMPVDPGNLLMVGTLDAKPVIGAPGCARSPKENGFDWVLHRMLAGLDVTSDDLTGMGVGGLLMDVVSRGRPRRHVEAEGVVAVVLAAGQSRRMGRSNKLVATLDGEPLVRRAVRAAREGGASAVVVVTGHEAERVRAALEGLDVAFVHNPAYADGLSTSVRAGIAAVDAAGALVMLGDMPGVGASHVRALIGAFAPGEGGGIVVATSSGKRGNPVLFARAYFEQFDALTGDMGAKPILGANPEDVVEVEIGEAAAFDLDTPEMLRAAGGVPRD